MQLNSLLLYKQRPARLVQVGDRFEIELENGDTTRVRAKDVSLLHQGPVKSMTELKKTLQPPNAAALQEAWELLAG